MDQLRNFAYSNVATPPSPATSGTSLTVTAGQGALFPTAPFDATIWPSGVQPLSTNAEIVRVTAVSTDTFTITRAQYGTTAQSITAGYQIAQTIDANLLTEIATMGGDVSGTTNSATVTAIQGNAITSAQGKVLSYLPTSNTTRSSSATVGIGEISIVPSGTGAGVTLTLPTAVLGVTNYIINESSNPVTVTGTSVVGPTTVPPNMAAQYYSFSAVSSVWVGWMSIEANQLSIAAGGTGATTASGALSNLGAAPTASPTFTGTVNYSGASQITYQTGGAFVDDDDSIMSIMGGWL